MNKLNISIVALSALFAANSLANNSFPPGFEDLYQLESKQIKFKDLEGKLHLLDVQARYDFVEIKNKKQLDILSKILKENNVSEEFVNKITAAISDGQKNTASCEGLISDCVLVPDEFEFLFDFYTSTLYLFVNGKVFSDQAEQEAVGYASSVKDGWGGINHFDAYVGKGNSTDFSYSLYDEVIVGLPVGNIKTDFQYLSTDSDFELNEFAYNYEFTDKRLTAGLFRDSAAFNSTDMLQTNSLNKEISVNFGNSRNLELKDKKSSQRIFYFAPSAGLLTVFRGERIVLQKNVSSGQGYFTNDELPRGRYDVVVQIETNGQVTSREIQSIYNSGNDTLMVGNVDYLLSAGQYQKTFERFGGQENIFSEYDGQFFSKSAVVYRPLDWFTVGTSLNFNESDVNVGLGARLYLPYDSLLNSNIQFFDSGSVYSDVYFQVDRFTGSYSQLETKDDIDLANYLYGANDYKRGSISAGFELFNRVNGYISYIHTKQYASELTEQFEQSVISASVSFNTVANSNVDISVDYDLNADQSFGQDELSLQASWTIPLSQNISAQSQLFTADGRVNQFTNKLRTGDLFSGNSQLYASSELGHNYYGRNQYSSSVDLNANVNYQGQQFDANSYAYADDHGNYSFNSGFSSSQVANSSGVNFSSSKSDAYIVVNTDNRIIENSERDEKGMLVLESNGRVVNKKIIYNNHEVIPVRRYSDYSAFIDVESLDLFNSGESQNAFFSHPGTVIDLNSRITRIISFVSGFKNLFDERLTNVSCYGTGCVRQDNITAGIYKFSVMEGLNFSLQANELVCLVPSVDDTEMFNFGNNYCLPDISPTEQYITYNGDNKITLTFVGGFDLDKNRQQIEQHIAELGIAESQLITKVIDSYLFVYFKSDNVLLTSTQQAVLNKLNLIASADALEQLNEQYALVKR